MSEVKATPLAAPPLADPLARARKEASAALFTLAFLQLASTAMLALLPRLLGATIDSTALAQALSWTAGLATIYVALGVWARYRLIPAAAIGLGLLTVYLALLIVQLASESIRMGTAVQLLVQFVLAALLVKAIRTGLKVRRTSVQDALRPANGTPCEGASSEPKAPGANL
jgi:hypothetical protein